jgi:hypothetical protein
MSMEMVHWIAADENEVVGGLRNDATTTNEGRSGGRLALGPTPSTAARLRASYAVIDAEGWRIWGRGSVTRSRDGCFGKPHFEHRQASDKDIVSDIWRCS